MVFLNFVWRFDGVACFFGWSGTMTVGRFGYTESMQMIQDVQTVKQELLLLTSIATKDLLERSRRFQI